MNYIKNSDLALRLALNPLMWNWIPSFGYDGPTAVFPGRYTFALAFLFFQIFVDISDGKMDVEKMAMAFDSMSEDIMYEDDITDDE